MSPEEKVRANLREQVAAAFLHAAEDNSLWMSWDQVQAIRTICRNVEFAKAVFEELKKMGLDKGENPMVSPRVKH